MSETLTLELTSRNRTGAGAGYQLRKSGSVPGVVYGPTLKTPLNITVKPNALLKAYKSAGKTKFITVESKEISELNGQKIRLKELQVDTLKNTVTHVDFHMLDLTRPVRTHVPLKFNGKAKGMAEGGLMNILSRTVEVKCLPLDTPDHIDVDVTNIGLDETLQLSELIERNKGLKYSFVFNNDMGLVSVSIPKEESLVTQAASTAADTAAAAAVPAEGAAAAAPGAPAAAGAAPAAAGAAKAAPAAAAKVPAKK